MYAGLRELCCEVYTTEDLGAGVGETLYALGCLFRHLNIMEAPVFNFEDLGRVFSESRVP